MTQLNLNLASGLYFKNAKINLNNVCSDNLTYK